ncbi:MAG: hypothetical protein AAF616_12500 [Bacteroidota bacterium]
MINDRIFHLITLLKKNPTSFAESLNVSVTVIFNIIKGRRSKPSYDLILNILQTYNRLSSDWLIKGEGPVWNDDVVASEDFVPSNVRLTTRLQQLVLSLGLEYPKSAEVYELDELVNHLIRESAEQKRRLLLLQDRKDGMIEMLKRRLKIKGKSI